MAGSAASADDEMAELLDQPLRGNAGGSASDSDSSAAKGEAWDAARFMQLALDIVVGTAFWYVLLFTYIPDVAFYIFLGVLLVAMVGWRVYRVYWAPGERSAVVPYTCGFVASGGKELFLVATIHISPRAPKDVEAVIESTHPDVAMIELDEERLDRMRDHEPDAEAPEPKPEDLQAIRITRAGAEPMTIRAQRALWNAEWTDRVVRGDIVFDEGNKYGLEPAGDALDGNIALMHRGSPNGEFAPFALKAHNAHRGGADAVFVINNKNRLPVNHIGGGSSITGDLKVAMNTCNCGFPAVPLLLLPHTDGEKLRDMCRQPGAGPVSVEFKILADSYPRRTLRRRLCQACALMFSGIGILYGIIQCFSVEVGAEFLAAEVAATARGIPCTCIDVNLNMFWSRLGAAVLPTPCNLLASLWSWLAFPRVFFQLLFPPAGNVDIIGSMFLHAASFPLRTWVAFLLAGFCASTVTNKMLELFGYGAEQAAERTGAVSEEDGAVVQTYIMLAVEMYVLPQVYLAVAASRDEAMYLSMVAKSRERGAQRMVVVVGAGHANGILQRAKARGL